MAANSGIDVKVFYLWDRAGSGNRDQGFGHSIEWDLPLLEGYEHEFVANTSRHPGTERFWGMRNMELASRIAEFKPEAALLIGYRYASMMRLIFTPKRRRGYPLLFRGDSHRLFPPGEGWKSLVRREFISTVYRRFAACLYVGRANRDYFRLHGMPDEKLFFAPHAVDNDRFMQNAETARREGMEWRRKIGIPDGHLLGMFAGKLEEKKRPLDLLAAFERLHRSDVSLLFVGSGKLEQELRAKAERIPNVFFAPFQNQSVMPRTYAGCDLFILPSYGPEETWGLAINEALCLARPVIVSSHVGCAADLVRQNHNGWTFPAGNVEALASTLREALSNPEQLRRFGQEGRRIVEDYDYATATRGLQDALAMIRQRDRGRR
ncbi:MAG: glycosyltransferase family 4 protein [Blastocatellia bacterium]|nr:glycosyltransferase family 4 protein [Blastocatellia bacterium]